jgi:hypothetical protein
MATATQQDVARLSEDPDAPKAGSTPEAVPTAVSRGSTSDRRRASARGNIPGDSLVEPVLLRQSGREKGGVLYLSRDVLLEALAKAGIPLSTPTKDLEVMRKVLGGRRHIGQVLLEIRVRRGAGP